MTSENPFVELTWRGQRVGRVKLDAPGEGTPGFLYHEAPLPVGAVLEVVPEGGGMKRVRVVGVVMVVPARVVPHPHDGRPAVLRRVAHAEGEAPHPRGEDQREEGGGAHGGLCEPITPLSAATGT